MRAWWVVPLLYGAARPASEPGCPSHAQAFTPLLGLTRAVPDLSRTSPQFVTSTPVTCLLPGAYCKSMRHLCVDWDVAFESREMLAQCTGMEVGG